MKKDKSLPKAFTPPPWEDVSVQLGLPKWLLLLLAIWTLCKLRIDFSGLRKWYEDWVDSWMEKYVLVFADAHISRPSSNKISCDDLVSFRADFPSS